MEETRWTPHPTLCTLGVPFVLLLSLGCGDGANPTAPPAALEAVHPSVGGAATHATPKGPPVLEATAEFYANPPEICRETRATLVVTEPLAGGGTPTLDLTYSVFGTCGDAEGLFYYDLTTEGAVAIDPADVFIHPGLRWATVDATVRVFDEEGGVYVDVRVQAEWERVRSRRGFDQVVARLAVSSPYLSEQYLTNPLFPSVEAELTKSRP